MSGIPWRHSVDDRAGYSQVAELGHSTRYQY